MEKKMDGIIKLSGKDLAKSRKIILESIGEKAEETDFENTNNMQAITKKMDSIIPKKALTPEKKVDAQLSALVLKRIEENKKIEQKNSQIGKQDKEERIKELIKEKEDERHREKEMEKKMRESAKTQAKEEKKKKEEAIRLEKERKREEQKKKIESEREENRKKEEADKLEREKEKKAKEEKEAEEKLVKEQARKEREKKKILEKARSKKKFKKRIERLKKNLGEKSARAIAFILSWKGIKQSIKFLSLSGLWMFCLSILGYIVFATLILKFDLKPEKSFFAHIPVPAAITKFGYIDINDYKKMKSKAGEGDSYLRYEIVSKIITANLSAQYGINPDSKKKEELENELNEKMVLDRNLNRVSFLRISDIRNELASDNFYDLARKKADKFGKINEAELAREKITEIDGVIATAKGYYLISGNDYIFVSAITFDSYMQSQNDNLKIYILAK